MGQTTILVTGGDAEFFVYLEAALTSVDERGFRTSTDIGVLDQGLTTEQLGVLETRGCKVERPEWTLNVPHELRDDRQIGLVARTCLRDYFPGYDVYVWLDADAWIQSSDFLAHYVDGARAKGAAVTPECGCNYRRSFGEWKWWHGNMAAAYGTINAMRLRRRPVINIGIMALHANAPHWKLWTRRYQEAIDKTGKVNLDQHAFNATVYLDQLGVVELAPAYNWICTLGPPVWDDDRKTLVDPGSLSEQIVAIHLAGPRKNRTYTLATKAGSTIRTQLTYPALKALERQAFDR